MTTTTTQTNWFADAKTLRSAFLSSERTDGSPYRHTKEEAESEEMANFLTDVHDKELPNDWRYNTLCSILCHIEDVVSYNKDAIIDWNDQALTIADQLVDFETYKLFKFYADNVSRTGYLEQAKELYGFTNDTDTIEQLKLGQLVCLESMVNETVTKLGLCE